MGNLTALAYAVFSAFLLSGAYPPVGLGYFAFVGLVPLFIIVRSCTPGRVLLWTWLSGVMFLGITLFWLRHITWIGMIFGVSELAFFYSVPFVIASIIVQVSPLWGFMVLPFAVAGIEWLRSFDLLAFPWMILGNSQTSYPFFIQFADITSAYGVSAWVVMVNIGVYLLILKKTVRRWLFLLVLFVVPTAYSITVLFHKQPSEEKLTVALIQGNIMPEEKWGDGLEFWNVNLYRTMSIEAMEYKPDLFIWPETAVPAYLLETPRYRYMLQSLVDSTGVPLLTGTPAIDLDTGETWNSAAYFVPGEKPEIYHKIHLVPFGEAIPLDSVFPALRSLDLGQANWDKGTERVIFTSSYLPSFCTLICFESIFPDLVRSFVKKGVEFITVVTNDVWFGPKSSPEQHAMISVMRAIEFHRPVVRCANTGISMIIDPYGRVKRKTEVFKRDTLIGTITPRTGKTVYLRFGNIFSLLSLLITLTCLGVSMYVKYHPSERKT